MNDTVAAQHVDARPPGRMNSWDARPQLLCGFVLTQGSMQVLGAPAVVLRAGLQPAALLRLFGCLHDHHQQQWTLPPAQKQQQQEEEHPGQQQQQGLPVAHPPTPSCSPVASDGGQCGLVAEGSTTASPAYSSQGFAVAASCSSGAGQLVARFVWSAIASSVSGSSSSSISEVHSRPYCSQAMSTVVASQVVGRARGVQLHRQLRGMAKDVEGKRQAGGRELHAVVAGIIAEWEANGLKGCGPKEVSLMARDIRVVHGEGQATGQVLGALQVLDKAAVRLFTRQVSFSPQDHSLLVYAFAKLGFTNAECFRQLARVRDWQGISAQSIANIVWAYATAGYTSTNAQALDVVGDMVVEALPRLHDFKAQNVSNLVWGLAKFEYRLDRPQLLRRAQLVLGSDKVDASYLLNVVLRQGVVPKLPDFTPQNLSNTLYGCALLKKHLGDGLQLDARLLRQLVAATVRKLSGRAPSKAAQFTPQNLSNIALAAARLEHREPGLLPAVMEAAQPLLQQFNAQDLANLLWALAVLEPTDSQGAIRQLLPWVVDKLGSFNAQGVANTAWACAVVLGQQVDVLLAMALLHRAASVQDTLQAEERNQLYQMVMLLPGGHAAVVAQEPGLQGLLAGCRDSFMAAATQSKESSLQREVHRSLQQIQGLAPHLGYVTEDGLLCVDIALLDRDGVRVAVEVDGPSRYTRNKPYTELGKTVLKRRLLEAAGWRVVNVPLHEWRVMAASDRVDYLRELNGNLADPKVPLVV
jgi:hypothetical protein